MLSISTDRAIFRVPHVAAISSNSSRQIPGSVEGVTRLSPALCQLDRDAAVWKLSLWFLFPPLSGFPVLRGLGGEHRRPV